MWTDEKWRRVARAVTRAHSLAWDTVTAGALRCASATTAASIKAIELANATDEMAAWRFEVRNEESRTKYDLNIIARAWLETETAYRSHRAQVTWCWAKWRELGFDFRLDPRDREGVSFWVHVGPGAVYTDLPLPPETITRFCAWMEERFGDRNPRHTEVRGYASQRNISLRLYRYDETHEPEWVFRLEFWNADGVGYSDVEWWRDSYVNLTDAVFGSEDIVSTPLTEYEFEVPMPERVYRWHAKEARVVRTRPRWFGQSVYKSITADALPGEHIPFPGKGENAWDIGMNGLFGCGIPGDTPRTEMGAFVRRVVTRDREKRGFSVDDAVQYTAAVSTARAAQAANPSSADAAASVQNAEG